MAKGRRRRCEERPGPLIDRELLSLAGATGAIALLHAVLPTHWLPFALVGRAQRWPAARLAGIAALAALGHGCVTGLVGGLIAFAGNQVAEHLEVAEKLGAIGLIAFGVVYAVLDLRHIGHRHLHHVHDGDVHDSRHHHTELGDRAAVISLVALLSVSPCVALTPIFFRAGALGLGAALAVAATNAAVTVPTMTAMTLLAARGLRVLPLERAERHERTIVGGLLAAIGVAVLLLHGHEQAG